MSDAQAPLVGAARRGAYGVLGLTILAEVTGSMALAAGADHPGWYALTVAGFAGSFIGLATVLRRGLPLGVAYGIWGATGVALTALGGRFIFGDPLTLPMLGGLALIIAGVLLVEFGSQRAHKQRAHEQRGES